MIDIPGIILAGGLSRRMGGGDKGLLMLGKTTIIERVIDKISPQVVFLAININGDSSRFPDYKLPIIQIVSKAIQATIRYFKEWNGPQER